MVCLKMDVQELADMFETFRAIAMKDDGPDPLKYFSISGLSWASALKMLRESSTCYKMSPCILAMSQCIRGGMTFVNEHLVRDNEILHIDINNLYCQILPCSDSQWVKEKSIMQPCH